MKASYKTVNKQGSSQKEKLPISLGMKTVSGQAFHKRGNWEREMHVGAYLAVMVQATLVQRSE